ncbi:[NiFe] hydrogenase metallocenter assembly protein HypE [Raoultella ornithinolytica]|nr:[NiFe] hydrogenase metallocenter assembly protein HypE [Raoultella ornithinolytica]
MKSVQLAHGSGGQAMQQLIASLFMQAFANPWLAEQEDQARLDLAQLTAQGDRLAFSTDSYVIDPLFFPRWRHRQAGSMRHRQRCGGQRRPAALSLLRVYSRRGAGDGHPGTRG